MKDVLKQAVDAIDLYDRVDCDRCALVRDTPSEWILLGTASAYVSLARDLLEFVRVAQSSNWSGSDLEEDSIAGVKAIVTNAIQVRFRPGGDATPVAACLCGDDLSVEAIQKRLQG
jgi:hypothetical protein